MVSVTYTCRLFVRFLRACTHCVLLLNYFLLRISGLQYIIYVCIYPLHVSTLMFCMFLLGEFRTRHSLFKKRYGKRPFVDFTPQLLPHRTRLKLRCKSDTLVHASCCFVTMWRKNPIKMMLYLVCFLFMCSALIGKVQCMLSMLHYMGL